MSKHYSLRKLPNLKTIRYAALTLLNLNKVVTTLEVKDYLYQKGYAIEHADIIHWMSCLSKKEGWESTFDGQIREYRMQAYPGYDLCCEAVGFSSN